MITYLQAAAPREERRPLYFGPSGGHLFGCYHAPFGGSRRGCAIVLCYPFGQEYIRSHRSFGQLARRLAAQGFPVLRFDYFACGDSAGEAQEGHVRRWLADVTTAIEEVRRLSGAERVALVGLRLGGALAALTAAERVEVDSLVLWDPVIRGREYCAELQTTQSDLLRLGYLTPPRPYPTDGRPSEVFGFPVTDELWREIEAIDLLVLERAPARQVLLVESGSPPGLAELRERLEELDVAAEHQHLPEPKVWLAEPLKGIVPHSLLEAVVAWLARVHA